MRCYVVSKHVIKSFQKSKKYKIRVDCQQTLTFWHILLPSTSEAFDSVCLFEIRVFFEKWRTRWATWICDDWVNIKQLKQRLAMNSKGCFRVLLIFFMSFDHILGSATYKSIIWDHENPMWVKISFCMFHVWLFHECSCYRNGQL